MTGPASVRAGRRVIEISHPDKLLFPAAGVTKLDLARHYALVGPRMVPLVRDRPVAIHSFPGGIEEGGHYIKQIPKHFPDWIQRVTVPKRGGTLTQVVANDTATLVYLANFNCITPHVWLSRADQPDVPDRLIFDLDPPEGGKGFADVRAAARDLGDLLRDRGFVPFAMTTGSKGLHVTVPIRRGPRFEEAFRWAKALGQELADANPRKLTLEFLKANREGRIYVDVRRIAYAQHGVAPYAVRPRERAPVAIPLHWDELSDRTLKPDRWTIATTPDRLESDGDPWRGIGRYARALRV